MVRDQLPDSHPSKKVATEFASAYEAGLGPHSVSAFGDYLYAVQMLAAAVPGALHKCQPGSAAFREARRSALENTKDVVGIHGVYALNSSDHVSHEARKR